MLDAFKKGYRQADYAELTWPPLNMHPDDYYVKCNRFRLVAGIIGAVLRNIEFAEVDNSYLSKGVNVAAIGGGAHLCWTPHYMHTRYGIPLDRLTIGVGSRACQDRIWGLASSLSTPLISV